MKDYILIKVKCPKCNREGYAVPGNACDLVIHKYEHRSDKFVVVSYCKVQLGVYSEAMVQNRGILPKNIRKALRDSLSRPE